ncbi:MAG: transglycosylase domain-containing protein [Patescibacteria group bacterium]|nr:transglycosylase domain-containing protein [Patescibacteria group bacterium]MCL5095761.1 transglycosylase domain-containing protein [Patescibacteria group bacterium]
MARKGRPVKKKSLMTFWDVLVLPFVLLFFFLIKIGDTVRWFFKVLWQLIKIFLSLRLKLPHPYFPRYRLPTLPKLRISLPKISLPQPQIKLPSLKGRPQGQGFILGVFFTLIFVLLPYETWLMLEKLPHPQLLAVREIPVTTKIFDRNGFLLYEIYAEQNRTPVTLAEIPPFLKQATIAIEDKEFYNHLGFSPRGILRATREIILHRRIQGGSTITQQLIRSALLNQEVTLPRKIKEIILSFWAERIYSKDQILEMYFNQVPYGGTAWGIEAASHTYFGKSVKDLNLAEASYLAGLPASPSVYSPFGIHPEQGLTRQKEVLQRMMEDSYLDETAKLKAEETKLQFATPKTEIKAPHFVMYIKDLLERKYGSRLVQMGGLRVTTTLDLPTQEIAQSLVTNEVERLKSLNVGNGAVLITNPKTGEILAMVGSKDYFGASSSLSFKQFEGAFNVTLALRQPGSSIKVVNYALALTNGLTAATVLDDTPATFQVPGQPPYTPKNYDGKFHGQVTLREALANSYNVPAVKILAQMGVKKMIEQGKKMGIASWPDENRYGLSLTLGGGEVTMLDMARVYGTLANQGEKEELVSLLKITDYKGQVLEEHRSSQGETVLPAGVAFILSNILADNHARSAAFGLNSLLVVPGKTVAVKTGTSNDLRDNWAIGFTPSYVVVTWVGNNDNSPMNWVASGVTGATPIWQQLMINLLKDKPDELILPGEDILRADVCGKSEYFLKGTFKNLSCPSRLTVEPSPSPLP